MKNLIIELAKQTIKKIKGWRTLKLYLDVLLNSDHVTPALYGLEFKIYIFLPST